MKDEKSLIYPGATREKVLTTKKKKLTTETPHERYIETLQTILNHIETQEKNMGKIVERSNLNEFLFFSLVNYLYDKSVISKENFEKYLAEEYEKLPDMEDEEEDNTVVQE